MEEREIFSRKGDIEVKNLSKIVGKILSFKNRMRTAASSSFNEDAA